MYHRRRQPAPQPNHLCRRAVADISQRQLRHYLGQPAVPAVFRRQDTGRPAQPGGRRRGGGGVLAHHRAGRAVLLHRGEPPRVPSTPPVHGAIPEAHGRLLHVRRALPQAHGPVYEPQRAGRLASADLQQIVRQFRPEHREAPASVSERSERALPGADANDRRASLGPETSLHRDRDHCRIRHFFCTRCSPWRWRRRRARRSTRRRS